MNSNLVGIQLDLFCLEIEKRRRKQKTQTNPKPTPTQPKTQLAAQPGLLFHLAQTQLSPLPPAQNPQPKSAQSLPLFPEPSPRRPSLSPLPNPAQLPSRPAPSRSAARVVFSPPGPTRHPPRPDPPRAPTRSSPSQRARSQPPASGPRSPVARSPARARRLPPTPRCPAGPTGQDHLLPRVGLPCSALAAFHHCPWPRSAVRAP